MRDAVGGLIPISLSIRPPIPRPWPISSIGIPIGIPTPIGPPWPRPIPSCLSGPPISGPPGSMPLPVPMPFSIIPISFLAWPGGSPIIPIGIPISAPCLALPIPFILPISGAGTRVGSEVRSTTGVGMPPSGEAITFPAFFSGPRAFIGADFGILLLGLGAVECPLPLP